MRPSSNQAGGLNQAGGSNQAAGSNATLGFFTDIISSRDASQDSGCEWNERLETPAATPQDVRGAHDSLDDLCRPQVLHGRRTDGVGEELKPSPLSLEALDENEVGASSSTKGSTCWSRMQSLWLHWATAYRILIAVTLIVNLVVLVIFVHVDIHPTRAALSKPLVATSTNIFVAVLIRQEALINASFSLVAKTSSRSPLKLRKILADFHHYGGLHVGCSVSALSWYVIFVVLNTAFLVDTVKAGQVSGWMVADIATCYIFLLFISLVCIAALPSYRIRFHNNFERTHRFGGWAALFVLWVNAGVSSHSQEPSMYANPAVWLLAATTVLIALPWLRIRRVHIHAEAISGREVRLTFPYTNMPYTSTARFSLSPLVEWHAFATIPSADGHSAYIVISQAGDWTKAIIKNPPKKIWIRQPAAKNFLAFAPVFNSLLLVATGAGIGPLLSLLCSPAIAGMKYRGCQVRVMWCVYEPNAPHWEFVQNIIRKIDPMPKIFDSRNGRPDMAFEANYMREVHDIEAVMVVSNEAVTREVVKNVKTRGGAAYGAVFDS